MSRTGQSNLDINALLSEYNAAHSINIASRLRDKQRYDQDRRDLATTCAHCGKEGGASLRACTRCKSARYCNKTCQRTDYKKGHRRECSQFVYPPRTRIFRTTPLAGESYPPNPSFAQTHEDGVGCWVSIGGRMDCDMRQLTRSLHPLEGERKAAHQRKIYSDTRKFLAASARTLITFNILVQNRRGDGVPVLVFGSRAQVVSYPLTTDAVLRGKSLVEQDNSATINRAGSELAVIGPAIDPWDKTPRANVYYLNGQQVDEPSYPEAIKDATEAIVLLKPGDYAVIFLQFRVGDDKTIFKDFQAVQCLDKLFLPFVPWDGNSQVSALASTIPPAYTLAAPRNALLGTSESESPGPPTSDAKVLCASFDQYAVSDFYRDFVDHGEDFFLRTHYGDSQANVLSSGYKATAAASEVAVRNAAAAVGLDFNDALNGFRLVNGDYMDRMTGRSSARI